MFLHNFATPARVWLLGSLLTFAPYARAQQLAQTPPTVQPETTQITSEALGWLTDLIRMNTSNPPGNELEAAKYVAGVLQKENIPAEVVEIAPGRGMAIGRLQA